MQKGILETDLLYCDHLGASPDDKRNISNFTVRDVRGTGLKNYIQNNAFSDEASRQMRTYLVRDNRTSELVGYFSLKAGLVSYNERDVPVLDEITGEEVIDEQTGEKKMRRVFDTLPGIELANFAVNQTYINTYPDLKGTGLVIFNNFILPIVMQISDLVGAKIIYIFALPIVELISRYEQYGFLRLRQPIEAQLHSRLKPWYDDSCIFMFQPIEQEDETNL